MDELQQTLYTLLQEVDTICKKHQITYYLSGGSVIGALRHRGFIPWDDDIDVIMTRENWLKFNQIIDDELADNRELITAERSPSHTKITIKYMNKETSTFFLSQILDYTGCGLSLDIITLEPIPPKKFKKRISDFLVYNELLTPFFVVNEKIRGDLSRYKRFLFLCRLSRKKVISYFYHKIFLKKVPEDFTHYLYRWGEQLLIYSKDLFGEPEYVPFEGMMAPIPQKAYEYLCQTYGDSWYFVPTEKEQETHTTIQNLHMSYNNVIDDYKRFLDKEALLEVFRHRKELMLEKTKYAPSKRKRAAVVSALLDAVGFQKQFTRQKKEILDLYKKGEHWKLDQIFADYTSAQLQKRYFANDLYFNIEDADLARVITTLCMVGKYFDAQKLCKLRLNTGKKLPKELQEAFALLDASIQINAAMNTGRTEEIERIYKANPKAQKEHVDFVRAEAYLAVLTDPPDVSRMERAQEKISDMLKHYPQNGELMKAIGDVLWAIGKKEQAVVHYKAAREHTRNGFVLLNIQDRLKEFSIDM